MILGRGAVRLGFRRGSPRGAAASGGDGASADRALAAEPDQMVLIGGHTDNVPISNARFESNWSLSAARAVCSGAGPDRGRAALRSHRRYRLCRASPARPQRRRCCAPTEPSHRGPAGADSLGVESMSQPAARMGTTRPVSHRRRPWPRRCCAMPWIPWQPSRRASVNRRLPRSISFSPSRVRRAFFRRCARCASFGKPRPWPTPTFSQAEKDFARGLQTLRRELSGAQLADALAALPLHDDSDAEEFSLIAGWSGALALGGAGVRLRSLALLWRRITSYQTASRVAPMPCDST